MRTYTEKGGAHTSCPSSNGMEEGSLAHVMSCNDPIVLIAAEVD